MYPKRFLIWPLVGLLIIGLLVIGGSAHRRNAWTQGYMMGRMAAESGDGAVMPYQPYGMGYFYGPSPTRGIWGAVMAVSFGLFSLLIVAKLFRRWAWAAASGNKQGEWGEHGAPPWAKEWSRHRRGRHCPPPFWFHGWEEPPSAKEESEDEEPVKEEPR